MPPFVQCRCAVIQIKFSPQAMPPSYKITRPRLTLKTTLVMPGYAEKGEMHLLAIIYQRLIISGDVELNPGPLGGKLILLHSLEVCYCMGVGTS